MICCLSSLVILFTSFNISPESASKAGDAKNPETGNPTAIIPRDFHFVKTFLGFSLFLTKQGFYNPESP
jgi:hypothetical protein